MNTTANIWTDTYPIRFYHVKESKTVCPTLLCDFMQDSSVNHIEALGFSLDKLHENNHGWVLSKMFLKLNKLPVWKNSVNIETWQPGVHKLYALRDFILTDDNSNEIGRATTYWLAIDTDKHRILRPETYLCDKVFNSRARAIIKDPVRLPDVTDSDHTICFKVHNNNLDLNGHTNSIVYLKWVFKILKDLVPKEYSISDIEANYISQSFPGDNIHLYSKIDLLRNGEIVTYHSLINEDLGKTISNFSIKHSI